jgi:PAS domain S-box-containing protein
LVTIELIYNLSLLVAIIVFSGFIDERIDRKELRGKIFQGILFGATALIGMINSYQLEKGIFFDGRSIVISLCTLFFGPLAGFISLVPVFIYRIIAGGPGVYMGIGTVISSFLIGYYFYKRRKEGFLFDNKRLYFFGLFVHLAMLAWVLTLPTEKIFYTYKNLTFPILIVYPLISLVISKILFDHEEKRNSAIIIERNEKLFRTTLYSIGDAVITTDLNGIIQNMNPIAEQLTGWMESDARGKYLDEVFVIVNEDTKIRLTSPYAEIIASGKVLEVAYNSLLVDRKGKEISISDSGAPIIDDEGQIVGVVLIFRDQSREKERQRIIYESEARLKRAENIAGAGNWEMDLNTGLIYGSEGAQKLYGLKSNVWELETIKKLHLPEYREELSSALTNLITKGEPYDIEIKIRQPDGKILSIHSVAEFDKQNNKVFGVIEDISDYKNAIKALKESEEKFKVIFNRSFGLAGLLTPDGRVLEANETTLKMVGKSISEIYNTPFENLSLFSHSSLEQIKITDAIIRAAEGQFIRFNATHLDSEGNLRYIDFSISPVKDENGKTILLIPEGRDITDVIKAEEEIKERERVYATLLINLPGFVYRCRNDRNWTMEFISNGCEEITGYKPDEFINNRVIAFNDIITTEFQEVIWNEWQRILALKSFFEFEYKITSKDGSTKWVWERGRGIYSESGELLFLEGFIADITVRKHSQDALKESEELFRNLAESTSTAIFIYQGEKIVFVNKAGERLTGYSNEELMNFNFWDFIHPDFKELIKERGLSGQKGFNVPNRYEFMIVTKDGRNVWIDFAGGRINWKGKPAAIGSAFDITDKKLSEIKLKQDEELFRAISNLTSDYLFSTSFDSDGKTTYDWVGGAFEKLTGYRVEEYREIGGWHAIIHPEDLQQDEKALEKLRNNQSVITEVRTIHKNGNIVWVRVYAKPVWDYDLNKLVAVHGAVKDITEERRAQLIQTIQYNIANAITSSIKTFDLFDIVRIELSQLMNTTNFFVAFYDEKTNTLTSDLDKDEKDNIGCWEAEKSLTGYLIKAQKTLLLSKNEILSLYKNGIIELVGTLPEIWLGSPLKVGNRIIGAMVVQSYDDPHAYDDSSLKIFEVIANQLSLYIQRKRAEEELSILARAIYQTPLSIVVTDTTGNIIYVNPGFEKVTGYTKEETLGKNIRLLSSAHHDEEFYKNLWDTILKGKDWEGEILNRNKTGGLYWEHQIISPVINDNGVTTNFVAIKEDVTEKKRMIQEIIDAKERAEASEKLKTEFLAQISHEIRTPINIMTSNFQLIKDEVEGKIDLEFLELFSSISRASHRIIRTVDLILNMSELQTGAYQPRIKKINLDTDILQSLHIEYLHLAQSKKINLYYRCLSGDPEINGDEYSVIQIFANLIDNAIKYTDKGKIEVILSENKNREKIVEVKDTGIGMSKDFLQKLFQPFVQEEHGYTRSYEGNGLGLALVKNYCSLNNAEIDVESIKGIGSTFRVKFKS